MLLPEWGVGGKGGETVCEVFEGLQDDQLYVHQFDN